MTSEQQKEALIKRQKELISQNTLEVIKKVESMSTMLDINAPTDQQAMATMFEKTKIDHFNNLLQIDESLNSLNSTTKSR